MAIVVAVAALVVAIIALVLPSGEGTAPDTGVGGRADVGLDGGGGVAPGEVVTPSVATDAGELASNVRTFRRTASQFEQQIAGFPIKTATCVGLQRVHAGTDLGGDRRRGGPHRGDQQPAPQRASGPHGQRADAHQHDRAFPRAPLTQPSRRRGRGQPA